MDQSSPETQESDLSRSSLIGRLFNVFAVPGEVFAELKHSPVQHWNWLAPAILAMVVGWLAAGLIFSQPAIQQQLREMSHDAIEKQIEKSKASPEQAAQMRDAAEKFGSIGQKISGYATPIFAAFLSPFFWGAVIWLFGSKFLKAGFGFMKGVEVAGLSNMIGVLDAVVRTLLILATGNIFASTSPMLLIKDFDAQNPMHSILGAINIMTFWILGVRSLGMAKLANRSFSTAAACLFGFWAAYTLFFWGLALVVRKVFGQ